MNCRTCGKVLPCRRYAALSGGRRREYCNDACKDVYKYFNAFERSMDKVVFTSLSKSEWRSRLFQTRNGI